MYTHILCLLCVWTRLFPPPFLLRIDNKSSPIFFSPPLLPHHDVTSVGHFCNLKKTVGSCTIFLFCLADLLFVFCFLFFSFYVPIEKRDDLWPPPIPSNIFPSYYFCFVLWGRKKGGHCLFCYLSSLHWEFKHKCDVQLFLSILQRRCEESYVLCFYTLEWCTSILEISTASVGWATALYREKVENNKATKERRSLLLLLLLLRCCE